MQAQVTMFGQAQNRSSSFSFGGAAKPAFGGTTTSTAPPAFSFGGASTSAAQPGQAAAPAGGLFGSNASAGAAGQQSTFGAPASKPFSFGQPAAPAPTGTAPSGGGLFSFAGGAPQQNQQQQQQPQQSGGLFGGGAFGQSSTNNTTLGGGGLFGQAQPQQQQQQQPQAGSGGLLNFGQSAQPQQQGLGGGGALFGSTQPQMGQSQLGQSQLGQSQFAPGQSQFAQSQGPASQQMSTPFAQYSFHQKERYNDLPDAAKQMVEQLDTYIQGQTRLRDELKAANIGAEVSKSAQGIRMIQSELKSLASVIESDSLATKDLQDRAEVDRSDSNTLFEIARNFQNKSSNDHLRMFPYHYFSRAVGEFKERLQRYRATMEEVERQLSSIEHRDEHSPQAIANAIQAQNSSFMSLAAQVASLHSEIESLKKDYTKWYQQSYQSARDPFSMETMAAVI